MQKKYTSFKTGRWFYKIDLQDFITVNYTPYEGGPGFLSGPTRRTSELWSRAEKLLRTNGLKVFRG